MKEQEKYAYMFSRLVKIRMYINSKPKNKNKVVI